MALPIRTTPKLDKKSSIYFLDRIENDLKKPMGAIETPHLKDVIKIIIEDVYRNKR